MNLEQRAKVHAALGDPVRLRIAEELAVSDRSPAWLAQEVGVPSNLLAHHVNTLVDAAVVRRSRSEADGRRTYVSLTELGRATVGSQPLTARRVLFVCTHNSARSQFAQALWRGCSDVPAASAGTEPARRIHPKAVSVASSHGVRLQGQPELLSDDDFDGALVISVCDNADQMLDHEHLHWSVPDPARDDRVADFRSAYDLIESRIGTLADLVKEPS